MRSARQQPPSLTVSEQVAGTQTIARSLSVLRLLRDAEDDLGVTEIARALGLNASTTHRILKALVAAGYVAQNRHSERYRLGREAFLLGHAARRTLGLDAAMPLLERLAEDTGESVNLVIRDGESALVVLRVESKQPLRFTQPVGTRIPLYCTSSGKALLAFAGDIRAEVARIGTPRRLTPATITSPDDLLGDLAETRERGFSVNRAERLPGVCGIAAPVLDVDGRAIAALAVQGPQVRITDDRIPALGAMVTETAEAVRAAMPVGYQL
ncbi:MAG TPA: IclR family transcriptional regulator [Streptosporangiaceae bacterium]|nr:IclR family transcriptional regulator [Streptosporangiaceae bacterium]